MNKIIITSLVPLLALCGCTSKTATLDYGSTIKIDRAVLQDKIHGGWAGQTIGCTYGGPTEFQYDGGIIPDSVPIAWYENYMWDTFQADPGLYDDVYMDLTFAEVMARDGIDTPDSVYAEAFAHAPYKLWHANQTARHNILNGIMPPASGDWHNNPHADDIDFQIESDFIGMICPAMPNKASELSDRIGHIMNCGDGWYGGVYIGALYTLAFVSDDIPLIVSEALKTIPEGTQYHDCIADVIRLYRQYPDDWKQCWFAINQKYGNERGCPEGVFNGFDIDAKLNSAYVVIGLLYGGGDFFRTMDIATRCGQDSDCNPASAAGILGVIKGYKAMPEAWKPAIAKVEDIDFPYTTTSLNKMYAINLRMISDVLAQQGGKIEGDSYCFTLQKPEPVRREVSFEGSYPVEKRVLKATFRDTLTLNFTGNGVVVLGQIDRVNEGGDPNYVARLEASVDGQTVEDIRMPYDYITRKYDIFYTYDLPRDGAHTLTLKWLNPDSHYIVDATKMVVYAAAPAQILKTE